MERIVLLLPGFALLVFQQYISTFTSTQQYIILVPGILLLGVSHAAAGVPMDTQNANDSKKSLSKFKFLAVCISLLFGIAAISWFFPLAVNLVFILFAAYHFGKSDLYLIRNSSTMVGLGYLVIGKAVLTVHRMRIMHNMYPSTRQLSPLKINYP